MYENIPESRLDELAELVEGGKLVREYPPFPEIRRAAEGMVEFAIERGTCFGRSLDDSPRASNFWFYNSNGSMFDVHTHPSPEWIVVIEGSMWFTLEGQEERRLMVQDSIFVPAGVRHKARFTEDCQYYAIAVPQLREWSIKPR